MAVDFEPIAQAVFDAVKDIEGLAYASRYRLGLESLPDNPAAIVSMSGATCSQRHGQPARWTAHFEIGWVARSHPDDAEAPETAINAWLVRLQEAFGSDAGSVNTLGDLVDHAILTGEVEYVHPDRDFPWSQCWATVEVVVVD